MHRITKRFDGYPFAHRQHTHDSHCKLVHGHNWDFEICLAANELDDNGFVYDFGKFDWLKEWLEKTFDHTCLINRDDPQLMVFKMAESQGLLDLKIVDSCSSEGIAKKIYEQVEELLEGDSDCHERGVKINYVRVYEDGNNSAIYTD